MSELPTDDRRAQVQVIPFCTGETPEDTRVLLFKRNEQKGGFWQPITGGIEYGEDVIPAALREASEEAGISDNDIERVVDDGYTFEFTDEHRGAVRTFTEYVLALVMRPGFEPTLSKEHTEARWATQSEALALLKYDSNKNALRHHWPIISGESETTYEEQNRA